LKELQQIQGLFDKLKPLSLPNRASAEVLVSAAEFLLEGMTAHKRISRTEERSFTASEKQSRKERAQNFNEEVREREREDWQSRNRTKRGFN
jgi:magnesium chelatase subunit I